MDATELVLDLRGCDPEKVKISKVDAFLDELCLSLGSKRKDFHTHVISESIKYAVQILDQGVFVIRSSPKNSVHITLFLNSPFDVQNVISDCKHFFDPVQFESKVFNR